MIKKKHLKNLHRLIVLVIVSIGLFALVWMSIISVRITIALYQAPQPQAIFVLGGNFDRTRYAATLWQSHRQIDIWVSDFSTYLDEQRKILTQLAVPQNQIHLDGRATDTVTNFTTLVDQFEKQQLHHLYLVTSDYHIHRASAIAMIVLGNRGIVVTSMSMSSTQTESLLKVPRDVLRSMLWVVTGQTGAGFNPQVQQLVD